MDPFTALGAASGVVGVVGFGLQLATTLQTYVEGSLEADERIRAIANDISATSSALQQLETVIENDRMTVGRKIFSTAGLKGVTETANQCDVVFKKVVRLLNDATRFKSEDASATLDTLRLTHIDRLKWPWLEPKISRCRQELERLLLKLLVMLQVVTLSRHQVLVSKQPVEVDLNGQRLRKIIIELDRREKLATQKLAEMKMREAKVKNKEDELLEASDVASNTSTSAEADSIVGDQADNKINTAEPEIQVRSKSGSDLALSTNPIPHYPDVRTRVVKDIVPQPAPNTIPNSLTPNTPLRVSSLPSMSDVSALSEPQEGGVVIEIPPTPPQKNKSISLPSAIRPLADSQPDMVVTVDGGHERSLLPLEAFIIKSRKNILKIPLEQGQLWKQMQVVLARTNRSAWDTLLTLSTDDHADVCELLKTMEGDGQERILAAIETTEPGSRLSRSLDRILNRKSTLPSVIIFLRVVPKGLKAAPQVWGTYPPPPTPPLPVRSHFKFQYQPVQPWEGAVDEGATAPAPTRLKIQIDNTEASGSTRSHHIRDPRDIMRDRMAREAREQDILSIKESLQWAKDERSMVHSGRNQDTFIDVPHPGKPAGVASGASLHIGENGDYSEQSYNQDYDQDYSAGWEAFPRHHHPTRMSDVLEEDERTRANASSLHDTRSTRDEVGKSRDSVPGDDLVDDLLSKWTTIFGDEIIGEDAAKENDVEKQTVLDKAEE